MEITISSRGVEPSDALVATTRTKIGRLARFLDGVGLAQVHFDEEKNPRIADKVQCEVVIDLPGAGRQVTSKASAPDAFAALDLVVDKAEHQLTKAKRKSAVRGR